MSKHTVKILAITAIAYAGLFANYANAAAPITAVNANPSTVPFGYSTNISWTIEDRFGTMLTFYCPAGVLVYGETGALFPCNTPTFVSAYSAGFTFANTTGSSATLRVRLTPKDATGADYEAGSIDTYLTIGAIGTPILTFTASPSSIASEKETVLTWTGNTGVTGSNMQFECNNNLQFFSINPSIGGQVPCGTTVYRTDLAGSGSVTISVTNISNASSTARIKMLPMITSGLYDATHSALLTLEVGPKIIVPTGIITNFSASPIRLSSGGQTLLSWTSQNTKGVNFQLTCVNGVTASLVIGTSTPQILPCGKLALADSLTTATSSTLLFTNSTGVVQNVYILLLPQNSDGTYDATKSMQTSITIFAQGTIVPNTNPTSAATIPAIGTTNASTAQAKIFTTIKGAVPFNQLLYKGSTRSQVRQLQQMLAQDTALYPEGSVTGYFGPATDRAIKRFQERYNLARQGDEGYGLVGPKTRAKLNSLWGL